MAKSTRRGGKDGWTRTSAHPSRDYQKEVHRGKKGGLPPPLKSLQNRKAAQGDFSTEKVDD